MWDMTPRNWSFASPIFRDKKLCLEVSGTIDFWTRSHIIQESIPKYDVFRNSRIYLISPFVPYFGNDFNNSDQIEPQASVAGE
jgi:hypothetical protein